MKAWEDRQVQQVILKHILSVLTMPKLGCSLQPICKPWRLVSPPRPINQRVCGRRVAGLGVSNMEPSSGKRSSMFDLFPVFPGRYPQLDVQGCDSGYRSRSSLSSHRRRGGREWGSPRDRVALFCISFWLSSSARLVEQRGLHEGQKASVLRNEEQLRGLETAPRQRGQRAAEDRAAGLP